MSITLLFYLYYASGVWFTIWNMRRQDRSLGKLAQMLDVDSVLGGLTLLCLAALIVVLFWPVGVIALFQGDGTP